MGSVWRILTQSANTRPANTYSPNGLELITDAAKRSACDSKLRITSLFTESLPLW